MSDDENSSDESGGGMPDLGDKQKKGIMSKIGSALKTAGKPFAKSIKYLAVNSYSFMTITIFGLIMTLLSVILDIVRILLFDVIPFLTMYIGLPLFIIGALFGLLFIGGQILFVGLLFIGTWMSIKYLFSNNYKFKFISTKSTKTNLNKKENNNIKIKLK